MKRALVVEDDPDIVELIDHYLRAEGFEVESLGDGRAGARAAARGRLRRSLILDLQLPGLDGLSLCAELRRDKRTRVAAHRDADRPGRRGRPRGRPRGGRRRLRGQALQPQGAGGAGAGPPAPRSSGGRTTRPRSSSARSRSTRARHTVRWEGQAVHLTAKEFALLVALVEANGPRALAPGPARGASGATPTRRGRGRWTSTCAACARSCPGLADRLITVKSLGYRLAREGEE